SNTENSLRPGEFVRSLAMQILSHSSRRPRVGGEQRDETPQENRYENGGQPQKQEISYVS
ncbi:Uncharacterized protein OBRU01_08687, partial [Operophtera brumata]